MKSFVLFIVALFFWILFILNHFKFKGQKKKFDEELKVQNRNIIFVSNPNLDFKSECYQPQAFFAMRNSGNNPCEETTTTFNYKQYSTQGDYYIKRNTRYEI